MSNIIKPQPKPIIIATANPSHNWLKRSIYDPWKRNELPEHIAYIPAKITDNPHVPTQVIDDLRKTLPSKYFRMMVEGDWEVVMVDCPFIEVSQDCYIGETQAINNQSKYILAFDFNVNPATCLIAEFIKRKLYVVKEYYEPNTSLPSLLEKIKSDIDTRQIVYVCGDASGHARNLHSVKLATNYDIIAEYLQLDPFTQIVAPKSNPQIMTSQLHCNMVLSQHLVVISKHCKELLQDMISCQAVDNSSGDATKIKIFHNDKMRGHLLDAFRCLLHFVFS